MNENYMKKNVLTIIKEQNIIQKNNLLNTKDNENNKIVTCWSISKNLIINWIIIFYVKWFLIKHIKL